MDHALPAVPHLSLDGKRIAATSGAILVHAAVLMLLLLPNVAPDAPSAPEAVTVIQFDEVRPPPPPPPPPDDVRPVQPRTEATPIPLPDPPDIAVDDTPSAMDVYVPPLPDLPIANSFEAIASGPVFAQIAARVAPAPPYPIRAIQLRQSGEVVLRIRVDANGRPLEVTIERSSGSSILDEAARKFVAARWTFVPATQDGQAVEALALLPIAFTLPD
jgi:protein TonB